MLIDKLLFSDQVPLALKKGLDFHSARNLLISTNISNMETPGYKATDINFEDQLRDNIVESLGMNKTQVKGVRGQLAVHVEEDELEHAVERLGKVFGIAWFATTVRCASNVKTIVETCVEAANGRIDEGTN